MDNSHIADTFQIILLASLFVMVFLLCRQCRLLKRVLRKSARQNNIDTDDDGQYRYATPRVYGLANNCSGVPVFMKAEMYLHCYIFRICRY